MTSCRTAEQSLLLSIKSVNNLSAQSNSKIIRFGVSKSKNWNVIVCVWMSFLIELEAGARAVACYSVHKACLCSNTNRFLPYT